MTEYTWKILELAQKEGQIASVKYLVTGTKGELSVSTEGNWKFRTKYDYAENLTEHQVAHWLELDAQEGDRHMIKTRLDEQLAALENAESRNPPWKVETFKVTL
jgi:hypothetical protein